ncbi:MAG: ribosome modulation factor [Gammaproteobacteria bacterium]|nr:ribosome modulation factor [Gammaproteobacteria bacterium]
MSKHVRRKRDKTSRAYAKGYQTGIHGKSRELCPFAQEESRQAWINGWRCGREDLWMGLTGTAGVCVNESHATNPEGVGVILRPL